jgi:hypothetical protein
MITDQMKNVCLDFLLGKKLYITIICKKIPFLCNFNLLRGGKPNWLDILFQIPDQFIPTYLNRLQQRDNYALKTPFHKVNYRQYNEEPKLQLIPQKDYVRAGQAIQFSLFSKLIVEDRLKRYSSEV